MVKRSLRDETHKKKERLALANGNQSQDRGKWTQTEIQKSEATRKDFLIVKLGKHQQMSPRVIAGHHPCISSK